MMNFRVLDEDAERIALAAKIAGMSKSDFMRRAVGDLVATYTGEHTPLRADQVSVEIKKTNLPFPACPKGATCSITKIPGVGKLCRACGHKV